MRLLKTEFHGILLGNIHSAVYVNQYNKVFTITSSGKYLVICYKI